MHLDSLIVKYKAKRSIFLNDPSAERLSCQNLDHMLAHFMVAPTFQEFEPVRFFQSLFFVQTDEQLQFVSGANMLGCKSNLSSKEFQHDVQEISGQQFAFGRDASGCPDGTFVFRQRPSLDRKST